MVVDLNKMRVRLAALLAKARDAGSSDAEVAEAMAQAQKVSEKYGVTEATLADAVSGDYLTRFYTPVEGALRQHPVLRYCGPYIADLTGCKIYVRNRGESNGTAEQEQDYALFGLGPDVEHANWLVVALKAFLDDQWRMHRALNLTTASRDTIRKERVGYIRGYCRTVNGRLKEITWEKSVAGSTALVVQKGAAATKELEAQHGPMKGGYNASGNGSGSRRGEMAGAQAGQAASLGDRVSGDAIAAITSNK
jgi:hypothetical protein